MEHALAEARRLGFSTDRNLRPHEMADAIRMYARYGFKAMEPRTFHRYGDQAMCLEL